ncbi:3,4-dihydroxyphenylacetate 2,3-dioxygenase [Camelliibacillus cellulosilyticus]|uniref:3,4-dihydroxyphenylacetate 2,3-dioxygenase n=1 Tax=Camelliibacillus cellulosilyticus TaxID=2174486 RepID=A0ABV9GH49_9BACL
MAHNIVRAARAVIHADDLDAARAFYVDALGFILTEADGGALYLRGLEERVHHSLVIKRSDKRGCEAIGYRVASDADLDALAAHFAQLGLKTRWLEKGEQRALGRALRVQDITGLTMEFFAEMAEGERLLQRFDLYKGARMQRIDHFNCQVTDVEKAHDFYINELGFACSEYTATKEERIWASWLYRKPTVHDIAFMNGPGPRLHHVGFWLSDPMSVIHVCDVLAAMGYGGSIERGPGRHGLSNAFFLYLRDPAGNRIELYSGDYLTADPDFKPIRWDLDDPRRQTFWGHAAPDSWFSEAIPFLDIDTGKEVPIQAPNLSQQKPDFIT